MQLLVHDLTFFKEKNHIRDHIILVRWKFKFIVSSFEIFNI